MIKKINKKKFKHVTVPYTSWSEAISIFIKLFNLYDKKMNKKRFKHVMVLYISWSEVVNILLNYSNDQKLVRKLKSYILVPPGCNVYKYMDWTVQDQPKNLKEALIYVCIYKALYTGCPTNHHRLVNSSECLLSSILNKMLKTSCRLFR